MTKDEADRLKALVRERWAQDAISRAECEQKLAEIESDYQAANRPPAPPPKPRMGIRADDGPSEATIVPPAQPIYLPNRQLSLGNIDSGGPDFPPEDGELAFETSTEVVFGLESQFELMGVLGSGGFGTVYQARHRLLDQVRAVKRLKPRRDQTDQQAADARSRFLFEARALLALEHPAIVRLYDFNEDKHGLYLVMEYVPGGSLYRSLDDGRIFTVEETIGIGLQLCDALQLAHEKRVIHRDIKPANILLTSQGLPKLTDFGLARVHHHQAAGSDETLSAKEASSRVLERSGQTGSGVALGTPHYMPPEQEKSASNADARSDVFALGKTMYCMVTGERPSMIDMELVPDQLRRVLSTAMRTRPENRFQSMKEFAAALLKAKQPVLDAAALQPAVRPKGDVRTPTAPASDERQPTVPPAAVDNIMAEVREALAKHDYSAAASLLENIPSALRDQKLHAECMTKRDRVVELRKVARSKQRFSVIRAAVEELLQLQPNDADVLQWKSQIDKHVAERAAKQQAQYSEVFFAEPSAVAVPIQRAPANSVTLPPAVKQGTKAGERLAFKLDGIEYAFRWCPAGKFTMGSPASEPGRFDNEAQVEVELTRGFWLQETEVTQGMWQSVMGTTPWKAQSYVKEGAQIAASYVNWNDAQEFCEKLQASARQANVLPGSGKIVLPSEARWEYACRAGTSTAYSYGNDAGKLGEYAWYRGNAWDKGESYAHEVGVKKANAWGLLDLHGNVWEWCEDYYNKKLPGGRDPVVTAGSSRVVRGGSFVRAPLFVRCAYRNFYDPASRDYYIGFRVVFES